MRTPCVDGAFRVKCKRVIVAGGDTEHADVGERLDALGRELGGGIAVSERAQCTAAPREELALLGHGTAVVRTDRDGTHRAPA